MMSGPPGRSVRARLLLCFSAVLTLCLCVSVVTAARADNWANWRGPEYNGSSPDKDLPETFSLDPKAADNNLVWKAPYGGRTTPIVMNGRVYLINSVGGGITPEQRLTQQERVMCLDANTGKALWQHPFNVFLTDIVAVRLGWTNLVGDPETGNVYAHGTQGLLTCFDKDGKILWEHSLTEEYGRISGYGGRLATPAIDGDLLILSMLNSAWGELAIGSTRFLALDKKTGKVVWWSSTRYRPKDTYFSTPVCATINGVRLAISGGGDGGVHAFEVNTGRKVWSYIFGEGAVNLTPVIDGTRVYIGHGESNPDSNKQGRLICLDAAKVTDGKPALVWKVDGIKAKFATPILHEGRLYVCDVNARLYALDASTGKEIWKISYGRNGFGSPVLGDGKIYVSAVNGTFDILKPGQKKCERLHEEFINSAPGGPAVELNGAPAIADGRVYFLTSTECCCIGKKGARAPSAARADTAAAAPGTEGKPTHLLIYPADVVLEPGHSEKFQANVYDDKGRYLRTVKAEWSLAAMLPPAAGAPAGMPAPPPPKPGAAAPPPPPLLKGELDQEGKLSVDKMLPAQFGGVVAKAEGLTGRARVRVAPRLPYQQDFSKVPVERTPAGWVNCQGKFAVKEVGGKKVLAKLATNPSPLVARANAYIGMPTLSNYTIQADVMGERKGEDLPDMGVAANRYHLFLDGNKQRLRLVSWDALPRIDNSLAFNWKPDTWYTLKLTVELRGDKGLVRGKIWERGQSEPEKWTIEFEDPVPNREGSPALYGNAVSIDETPGTPIYYANVSVTPNKK